MTAHYSKPYMKGKKTWWRHQMEPFSASLAFCAGNSPLSVNSPHKGQWRGALMFSLICAWINDWVNNHETGDLRRHRGHYDVNIMRFSEHVSSKWVMIDEWWWFIIGLQGDTSVFFVISRMSTRKCLCMEIIWVVWDGARVRCCIWIHTRNVHDVQFEPWHNHMHSNWLRDIPWHTYLIISISIHCVPWHDMP